MKEKIAILTTFQRFNPGYSLSGIVLDQIKMLKRYGHEVHLFVNERFEEEFTLLPKECVHQSIPFTNLIDYQFSDDITAEHKKIAERTTEMLIAKFEQLQIDICIEHDFLFQGWYLPYGMGIFNTMFRLKNVRWLHWIHSVPTRMRDWWKIAALRPNHKMIYPNETDRMLVAEQYRGTLDDVRCIHHIKDIRSFFDFDEQTCRFIDAYPAVMQADVVKVYPASVDRLAAKRLSEVLQIIANIKNRGFSVCLVVANQWATIMKNDAKSKRNVASMDRFKYEAKARGLEVGKDFIFTSEFEVPTYEAGIPKVMIRELFQLSNLFIFPTREETFGLVLPEASLAGSVLVVTNKSLSLLDEITARNSLSFEFGSYNREFALPGDQYYADIARIIIGRMRENETVRLRSYIRQRYNWDALYRNEYEPIFAESIEWPSK